MEIKNSGRLIKLSPIFFLFILTIIFFHPVIFQGKTFYAFDTLLQYLPWSSQAPPDFRANNPLITDPVNVFYPYYNFIKKCISSRTFCFWKDYILCGVPTSPTGNPITFLFYLLFSESAAHDLLLWLHLFGAGLFMFLYLREAGLKTCSALIGAIAWMFNGYVMVWFEFQNIIILAPSLAASLYYFERWLKTRAILYCLCISCALALSISVGCAQPNIYQFIFACSYFIFRYIWMRRKYADFRKAGRHELIGLGLAIFMGILISSNFLFGNISTLHEGSHRQGFSFEELYKQTGQLPPKYLTTLIYPDFFGSPAGNRISFPPRIKGAQPYNNYNELCIYFGIIPLFLILACLPYLLKSKEYIPFYFFTALITLTMAMGSILYYPMAEFIPGLNLSAPLRILYIFGFSVSVLSALGTDILLSDEDKEKRSFIVLWTLLLGTAIVIYLFVQTDAGIKWAANSVNWSDWNQMRGIFQGHFFFSSPTILKPLGLVFISYLCLVSILLYRKKRSGNIFLFLTFLILSYDLISFGLTYNTASPRDLEFPQTEAIQFLRQDKSAYRIITYGNFMHNSFAPFGIQDAGGYSSFYLRRYGEFLHLSQHGPDIPLPDNFSRWTYFNKFGSPLLDLINVKYVLLPPSMPVNSPKLELVYDNEIKIYENKDAFPRAFFVSEYQLCNDRKSAYKMMASYSLKDFNKKVILESLPLEDFQKSSNPENKTEPHVSITSYHPGRIEISVSTDQKGFLILSDNYHPSWTAETDGVKTELLRANYIMQAVPVRPGNHKIVLKFYPKLRVTGLIMTAVGWVVLVVLIAFSGVARRKQQAQHSQQIGKCSRIAP